MATEEELAAREAELAQREDALKIAESARLTAEEEAAAERQAAAQAKLNESVAGGAPETPEEVKELAAAFAEYRKEVEALRRDLAKFNKAPTQVTATVETVEDRTNARLAAIAEHSHYCPGCGKLGKYPQKCDGTAEGPHKSLEMVPTEELGGDPAFHTAAPDTHGLAVHQLAA